MCIRDSYYRHKSHPNLGYTYKGLGNGLNVTETWPESDLEMIELTIPAVSYTHLDDCPEAEALIGEPMDFVPEKLDKMPNIRWLQSCLLYTSRCV